MINWFKKHFIPHEGNSYRPHILHKKNIHSVILFVIFLEIFAFLIPTLTHINKTGGMAAVLPAILGNLTNEERQTQHLNTLTDNPILDKAALMKAEDMAQKGYFAHTSPEGLTPWYWLGKVDYSYQYAGENLAINFTDSKDVTNAWMASPTHKSNIVKSNYTEMGTGIAIGMYEGKKTVFVAQVYANPLSKDNIEQKRKITNIDNLSINETKNTTKPEESTVLGAETKIGNEPVSITNEITVENDVDNKIKENKINTNPQEIQQKVNPTFWQKVVASPRNTMNIILYTVFGFIVLSLLVYMIIKIKNHHVDLITNGLILIIIIIGIFLINYYLSHNKMTINQSLDYSIESTQG